MSDINLKQLVEYRLERAYETFKDAEILAESERWNSAINRLYYATYYAVSALLISNNISAATHNGVKTAFSKHFIKTKQLPVEYGKLFSQLFGWRQKGDYDDMYDFDKNKVKPYFVPVKKLIKAIENLIEL